MPTLAYPTTRRADQTDDLHGTPVADPYRWLEETDSPETQRWIAAQNAVTFSHLTALPQRSAIHDRLSALWDFPKRWAPRKKGGAYFQLRNSGLQNQNVLVVMPSPEDEGRVLLDPNELSPDGTVAVNTWSVSPDGRWLAYAAAESGSDWVTWRIRSVATGDDLPELIRWSKFTTAAWLPDGSGFYYSRYAEPAPGEETTGSNYHQKLYFHATGTPQEADRLVYERPEHKEWGFQAEVTPDGEYLVITVWQGTDIRNRLYYQDLRRGGPVTALIDELEAEYAFIGSRGPLFYLKTNASAPRGAVIAIDVNQPERAAWRTVIPESADTLEAAHLINGELVLVTLHDAHHRLLRAGLDGTPRGGIPLPGLAALTTAPDGYDLHGEPDAAELFFSCTSFLYPVTVFQYDYAKQDAAVLSKPDLDFNADGFETRLTFATSRDGTRIPLFLTHRKGLVPDGSHPTLLYGYGGFNIAMIPTFNLAHLAWVEMGGVLAWSILRGGGEYGEEWHQAGMVHKKQNVFDDFIACAESLIAGGITRPGKLGIMGRSNGGLLVGACMVQRPDLFAAAVPAVGVMDMLRFHRFTIGWAWVSDYGSAEDPEQFKTLYAYSPYHNLKPGTAYPATLVTTGDHDDRVVPGHSFKFAAALQAAQAGDAPVLIRIDTKAGHGMGKPTAMLVAESADILAFLADRLGLGPGQGPATPGNPVG